MPISRPSRTTSRPAMDTMTQKSSHMSDAILNAPTLGPSDSLSCVSTKPATSSSRPAPSYRSAAPLSTASARSSGSSKMSSSSQSTIRPSSSGLTGMPREIPPPPMSESSCGRRSSASMLVPEGSRGGSSSYRSEAPSSHRSGLGPSSSYASSSSRYSEAPLSLASHRSSHGPSSSHISSSSRYSEAPPSVVSHRSSSSPISPSRISEAGPLTLYRSEAPLSMVSHDHRGTSSRRSPAPEASMVSTVSRQVSKYQPATPSPLGRQVAAHGSQGNAMLACIAAPAPRRGESVDITIKIHSSG